MNTVDELRNIPLPQVLVAAAAVRDRYDKARWHTAKGAISVTGMKFFNWNCSVGGGGAIDLVIHLYDVDFKGALTWLNSHFTAGRNSCCNYAQSRPKLKPQLKLPVADTSKMPQVKRYLIDVRKISPAVVDYLISRGDLYGDSRGNAVFLMRRNDNVTVGAELRGTGLQRWRGMAAGSSKDLGYFSIRNVFVDGVILCESAIDAVSCFLINQHYYCISTAGAGKTPCWLEPLVAHYQKVYCGFDADTAGDAMADTMIRLHRSIKRLRPQKHDWNDMLRSGLQTKTLS
jgi:hypothetical protein